MTTAAAIMQTARIQAAVEHAWRTSGREPSITSPMRVGDCYALPLVKLYPTTQDYVPRDISQIEAIDDLPKCLVVVESSVLGPRVVITTPGLNDEFFWVAGRLHFRNGWEDNYTKG